MGGGATRLDSTLSQTLSGSSGTHSLPLLPPCLNHQHHPERDPEPPFRKVKKKNITTTFYYTTFDRIHTTFCRSCIHPYLHYLCLQVRTKYLNNLIIFLISKPPQGTIACVCVINNATVGNTSSIQGIFLRDARECCMTGSPHITYFSSQIGPQNDFSRTHV